jgi:prepilin-type N-terminal cleavage/methylation domain-containing protein
MAKNPDVKSFFDSITSTSTCEGVRSNKLKKNNAFSLLEVSVVILIIGIFLAGIFVADGMISKFRLTAAKSLAQSSPIITFPSAALWLETSLDSSFNSSEANNGNPLSTWYDQRSVPNKVIISTAGASPTYSNTINRIHAVAFDGTANKYFTFDGSFLNNTDYTIFVLEKRQDPKGDNYFLGGVGAGLNNSLALGYSSNSQIIHAQGSNSYASGISSYSDSKDKPRIFTFTHSSTAGKQTYINGVLAAEDPSNLAPLTGISTLTIGQGYIGEIGEIAIFTKALNATDRGLIEDYLGKKWVSPINRNKTPNCIGGLVTINGCDNSSPVICSASGTGYNQAALSYTSGSSFSCDAGYTGSINYRCTASGPATNISGSCTPITCTAAAGTGYSAKSGLAYSTGSGTFNCDAGYFGTVTYTCTSSGAATGVSGSCSSNCTGGTIDTTTVPGAVIHSFKNVGDFPFQCPSARNVQVLVVAGGGGGTGGGLLAGGAGGGAGGLIYNSSFSVSTSAITVTVGDGGAGGPSSGNAASSITGSKGSNSVFSSLTAAGGGGGGARESNTNPAPSGGSGGGGGISGSSKLGGSASPSGQGNAGGNNSSSSPNYGGGGGGGAGSVGQNGTSTKGGDGGSGLQNSITGITPAPYYAGGGGSSYYYGISAGTNGVGKNGGGNVGSAGSSNTGGGGGGGADQNSAGGKGGSGIVIVRY